jgi:hypothetical protein
VPATGFGVHRRARKNWYSRWPAIALTAAGIAFLAVELRTATPCAHPRPRTHQPRLTTRASPPGRAVPFLGGVVHGASVHQELQYLVQAGLTPIQALRAATLTPARRFGLEDRGRIAEGLRADLLLVDGDPTTTISDTLNLRGVWRRGTRTTLSAS